MRLYFALALVVLGGIYLFRVFPEPADEPVGKPLAVTRDHGNVMAYVSGRGPRVVLLASLGRSVSDFNLLVPHLTSAGYRTVAVESRGVGASAHSEGDYTLYDLANDVDRVLAADGAGPNEGVFVIGHAFGNRVARAFAHTFSDRVQGVVLLAAGGAQNLQQMPDALRALRGSFQWWLPPTIRRDHIRYAFFAEGQDVPDHWVRGWYLSASMSQADAVNRTPESEWRGAGGAPILIIQGAQDAVAPPAVTSMTLRRDYPERVSVKVVDNAGHALLPEAPSQIARHILAFLN